MRWRCWPRRRRRSARLLAPVGGCGGGPDLISALPDDLLLLILARLPCAGAAGRTAVLSRRWHGLWARLGQIAFREVALPSVEAALDRLPYPPPAVSLLDIRVPDPNKHPRRHVPREHRADTAGVNSLLRAAARLEPKVLLFELPSYLIDDTLVLDLPCLRRATFIVLCLRSVISCVPAGVQFPTLEKLCLCHCTADLNALLPCCPRLRALHLINHNGDLTNRYNFHDEADNSTQEIEKHLVIAFSVLELHLKTEGHAFGAFVFHLLGMNQIRCATRRLQVTLQRSTMEGGSPPPCPCESLNWRSQTMSMPALEEVNISGFEGDTHEIDFLKLILKCALMLKRIILKLTPEATASKVGCAKICGIFKAHSYVECAVYHSSGLMHDSQNCWRT